MAYENHEQICRDWRKHGRPKENNHPAKMLKLESQRKLQRIAREEENAISHRNHNELMSIFSQNVNQVYKKLKKIRGDNIKTKETSWG